MAVSELYGRLRVPSLQQPGLPGCILSAQVGQARLAIGGGLGRGVAASRRLWLYPSPTLPAMGERADCARSQRDDGFNFQTAKSQKVFETVIASEAKQSILSFTREMDCFAWLAMTWNSRTRFHDLAATIARGVAGIFRQRGRGECRMPNAPAVCVHL